MKKRFLAITLALALCMGLAVPAFAADSEVPTGSYTVDLNEPDSAGMGVDGEFMVRYLNSSRSYDETRPRVDITRTLPQGSEFAWTGLRSSHKVYFRFFTDLDNNGTYDERLVVKESGKNVLAPYEEKYASSLTQVSGKMQSADVFASMLEEMGGKLSKDSSGVMTLSISSDSLCEFFGGSTLFEWGVMKTGSSDVVAQGTMLFAAGENPAKPTTPPAIVVEDIPASGTAAASTQTVSVDGKDVEFQMYALLDADGNQTNYIKLRDLAYILNGTKAQFNVGWDGAVNLETGKPYTANGSEMSTPFSGDRAYTGGGQKVNINGSPVEMTAIILQDDAGGGYNYFKLRDLGQALGFNVGWSFEQGVYVETDKPYQG